ncbi:MAG: ArsR/SmtB family transcription factor [Candidatus Woesearchaeota archaeon]
MNETIKLFKALSSETRFLIVKALSSGERCACELPGMIGRTQSNTSMHLAKLLDAGIVRYRRDGKKILYSIKDSKVKSILKVAETEKR